MEDWEFGSLGIYNYRFYGSKFHYFNFIRDNYMNLPGDIVEIGVFNGKSLLATGIMLKELGSDKLIYGFDNFSGLSHLYSPQDDPSMFETLFLDGRITKNHIESVNKLNEYRKLGIVKNSGDFGGVSLDLLNKKIESLGLDNIRLVVGDFVDTMQSINIGPIMSALIDCDLYESYKVSLPFVWNKLVKGGYIYLDEYYSLKYPGGRIAADEFFSDKMDKPQMYDRRLFDFERWYVRREHD
jgi:hypothetical protein